MIKNKTDALSFVCKYEEFELFDFVEGSIWFRNDNGDIISHTINHETKGIIGANVLQVADYIYRNRKKINEWIKNNDAYMVKFTVK